MSDGGACFTAADCSTLTSDCCLLADSTLSTATPAGPYYQTYCVPAGLDTIAVSTAVSISITAYGSGSASMTAPFLYSGDCIVRTKADSSSYLMMGAGAAALTASSLLFWKIIIFLYLR